MNNALQKIFNEDQKNRHDPIIRANAKLLSKNDKERKEAVEELIRKNRLSSAKDYFLAAMILHHGQSVKDSAAAVRLSKKSYKLGYKKALLFYATCWDRLLIKQRKKQKFGTQYHKKNARSKWKLLPVDPRTTDEERKEYDIAPLKELIKKLEKLNNKL